MPVTDIRKNPSVVCGHGRPSPKRMKGELLSRSKEGSVVVHDMEKAHKGLVNAAQGTGEPYKADVKN